MNRENLHLPRLNPESPPIDKKDNGCSPHGAGVIGHLFKNLQPKYMKPKNSIAHDNPFQRASEIGQAEVEL